MKKKQFLLLALLIGALTASCHPVMGGSSSVEPQGDSSEEISSSSEGGDNTSSSENTSSQGGSGQSSDYSSSEGGTSEGGTSESESSTSEGGTSEEPTHEHQYPSTPTRFDADPDYSQYIKGYNVYVCTYQGCNEERKEAVYYTKSDMLGVMNEYIATKTYIDAFELRQDLIDNGYPVVDTLDKQEFFGYDMDNKVLALSSDTSVTHFLSFREKSVSNLSGLMEAFADISNGTHNYSTIKLTSNITTNNPIVIDFANLFNLDLGGHLIDYTAEAGSAIKVTSHFDDKPDVVISNGTIQTKQLSGFNMEQTPKCVYFESGNSLRLTNLTLNNRAERGYGYADYPASNGAAKVVIKKCIINSPVVGVCIQTNNNEVLESTINGSVIVNGGDSLISKNKIDTSNITAIDVGELSFADNITFKSLCHDVYVTEVASDVIYDKYMITSADAILIFDRRSTLGTYHLSSVYMEYNELTVKSINENAFGYGIRYLDLDFDPSQSENHQDDIHIGDDLTGDNNVYKSLVGTEAYNRPGGYYK